MCDPPRNEEYQREPLGTGSCSRGNFGASSDDHLLRRLFQRVFPSPMQAAKQIAIEPKNPGGIDSPHGLVLFDGVCVLCSRGCRFVSKRDRRHYFRFVPIQLAEGRQLAEQLGIDPDRPDSFALVANGRAYVKSEAALRIARELPSWQWTWIFHLIPRTIRDAIYDLIARNRYQWFGKREVCILPTPDRSWPS
jgi:predicted DCC family thiol-disulfide oxidoreductase YuxK